MVLTVDTETEDFRFYKTLNEDVQLKLSSDSKHHDIQFENFDYVNLTGKESLHNAIIIAIMTRYQELSSNQLYDEFGCKVHELVKANQSSMVKYKIELFICEVLEKMRRIQEVNWINVTETEDGKYNVEFNVTSINDEIINGSVTI